MPGLLDANEEPDPQAAAHLMLGAASSAADPNRPATEATCCPAERPRLDSQHANNVAGWATVAVPFSFRVKLVTLVALVPGAIAQPVQRTNEELVFCKRYDETDSSFEQCQSWCRYLDQCQQCKCRACSMCTACHSGQPEDLPLEMCQDWCSIREHCSHCKCKACTFCQPCTPGAPDDVDFTDCQEWCSEKAHCDLCKCKGCPSCQSQCTPHSRDDFDYLDCQPWCKSGTYNCPYCKCKNCEICKSQCMPWCKAHSDCSADACSECEFCKTAAGRCEPWCQQSNCRKEACTGCKVCRIADDDVACDSGKRDDVLTEECLSWCSEKHGGDHCGYCACRRCPFCSAEAAKSIKDTGVPCPPFDAADSDTMHCEPFCKAASLLDHCDRCKCKACDFCPKRLDTGRPCSPAARGGTIPDDSDTERCEPFCALANAADHCNLCKCAGCSFCASVKGVAALPGSLAPRAVAIAAASHASSVFKKSPPPSPAPPSPLASPRSSRPASRGNSSPPPPPPPSQPSSLLSIPQLTQPPSARARAHHAQPSAPLPAVISPPPEGESLPVSDADLAPLYGSEGEDVEGFLSTQDETEEQPEEWPIAYWLWSLLSLGVLAFVGRFLQRNIPVRLVQRLRSHRRLPMADEDWRVDGSDETNDDAFLPIGRQCGADSTGFAIQSSDSPRALFCTAPKKDGRADSDAIDVYDSLIASRQRASRIDSEQQRFASSCHDDVACAGTRSRLTTWQDESDGPVVPRPRSAVCSVASSAQAAANHPVMPPHCHLPVCANLSYLDGVASASRCARAGHSSVVGLQTGLD